MRFFDYLPDQFFNFLIGFGAAALTLLFGLGYLPLTGIEFIDIIQITAGIIAEEHIKIMYLSKEAFLSFCLAFSGSNILFKIGSLFNISQQKELNKKIDLQRRNEFLKIQNAELAAQVKGYAFGFTEGQAIAYQERAYQERAYQERAYSLFLMSLKARERDDYQNPLSCARRKQGR